MATKSYICYGSPPWYCKTRLPDWVCEYDQVTIHSPNLGSKFLLAFNETERHTSWNITYDYMFTLNAVNGMKSILDGSTPGGWSEPEPFVEEWIWTTSRYVDGSRGPCWTSKDIYGWGQSEDPNAPDYLARAATVPTSLAIEYGWTDYGSDDELHDFNNSVMNAPLGWHSAGAFRCRVMETSGASARFEWFENDKLVATYDNRMYSDYVPSFEQLGTLNVYCKVTALDADGEPVQTFTEYSTGTKYHDLTLQTNTAQWKVVSSDFGGDSSDNIASSFITGIALTAAPNTVIPGGHSAIGVSVDGVGKYSKAFTAQLSGHTSAVTHLVVGSSACNLWVGADETASSVLVTVSSVQNPAITATITIYIDKSGTTEDDGTTAERLQRAFWRGFAAARTYFRQARLSQLVTLRITAGGEPTTDAGQLKRAFWRGFTACLGSLDIAESDAEIIATLTVGALYIKSAPAILNDNTLEVGKWQI